jgi:hypothetical protein
MTTLKQTRLDFLITGTADAHDTADNDLLAVGRFIKKIDMSCRFLPKRDIRHIPSFFRMWTRSSVPVIHSSTMLTVKTLSRAWYVTCFPDVGPMKWYHLHEENESTSVVLVRFFTHVQ